MADGLVHANTLLWFAGLGLMLLSFVFLFGKSEEPKLPRISVEPWPSGSGDERK
jgi:hypothetical protein